MGFFSIKNKRGFTTVELVVTLTIVSILVATAVISIVGIMPTYKLSRGVRQVFNTMLSARSKAVSLNQTFRFHCIDETHFKLEWDNEGTWTQDGPIQALPADVEIAVSPFNYFENCLQNLHFTSRGIIDVLNGAQTDPFIVVKNKYSNDEKSVTVNIGGNIKINK